MGVFVDSSYNIFPEITLVKFVDIALREMTLVVVKFSYLSFLLFIRLKTLQITKYLNLLVHS